MAEPQLNGCVQFYIAVTPQEMRDWPARCITKFFDGLAQVVHAAGEKAQVEMIPLTDGDNDERNT